MVVVALGAVIVNERLFNTHLYKAAPERTTWREQLSNGCAQCVWFLLLLLFWVAFPVHKTCDYAIHKVLLHPRRCFFLIHKWDLHITQPIRRRRTIIGLVSYYCMGICPFTPDLLRSPALDDRISHTNLLPTLCTATGRKEMDIQYWP